MGRVNIPILILNIITLGAGLALVIIGARNWVAGCGLAYLFVGLGAIILICPITCLLVTLTDRGILTIFKDKPKESE